MPRKPKDGRRKPKRAVAKITGGSVTMTYTDKAAAVKVEIIPPSRKKEVQ